jgi:hypothetical protein
VIRSSTLMRWFALPLFAIIFAVSASGVHAQGFRRPTVFRSPVVGFNAGRNFVPTPIGINLNRGLPPSTVNYLQATHNNLVVQRAATRLVNAQPATFGANVASANFAAFTYAHSPYSYNPFGYANPFGYVNPFGYGAYNPYSSPNYGQSYGSPYSYGSGYGSGLTYASSGYGAPAAPAAQPVPVVAEPKAVAAVSGFGIPTNDDGTIAWPFAFRLMSPEAKRELIDPLAGQLEKIANQASRGRANPNMVRESQQGVDRLYQWLRTHRLDMAEGAVRDANAFLGRVDAALRAMRVEA